MPNRRRLLQLVPPHPHPVRAALTPPPVSPQLERHLTNLQLLLRENPALAQAVFDATEHWAQRTATLATSALAEAHVLPAALVALFRGPLVILILVGYTVAL